MVPVTEVPFPAMTICPQTKSLQTRFNFTKHFHKLGARRLFNESVSEDWTKEERNLYEDVSLLCESYFPAGDGRQFSSGSDILNNLMKVSPNITDIFKPCAYRGKFNITCDTYFSPILTEEGICFTFNSLSAIDMFRIENLHKEYLHPEHDVTSLSEWTVDDGFTKDDTLNIYPRRALGAESFSIIFHIDKEDLDYLCLGPLQGFKVMLHNPAEFPRASNQFIISQLRHIVRLAVVPRMTMSSDGIDMFDPFRCTYSSVSDGPEMVVCNAGKVSCIEEAKEKMAIERLEGKLPSEDVCECLPACNSLKYKVESYQSEQDWDHYFRTLKDQSNLTGKEHAYLEVFFKEAHFDRWRRSELYGWADILSDCGGLLGLFMGVSVLSLVEIVYFLTCRLVYF
ncbi:amiloride-sensitive sodium channel domain-containing protein [Phthorimaea operculella]|nr:amiloride-sensitive sodium channel domain-containing protein [Phthorimaea operculella]